MAVHLDVHPRAATRIALVRLGPVTNVELFEYTAPDHNPVPPHGHDIGSHHLGLFVDDVDAAVRHLRQRPDVQVLGAVRTEPLDSPRVGVRWIRLVAPWGMQLELRSVPDPSPYHRQTADRRFGPCPAWTNRDDGSTGTAALPGLRNVDHLGYTVADLDAAVGFFVAVLGAELLYRTEPVATGAGGLGVALGVPATGTVEHAALRLGPTDNIELYRYQIPGAAQRPPRNSDVGGRHLALYVDDVDAAAEYLAGHPGVQVLGGPETIEDGPIAGDRWVYVRTPIGLYLEVVHMPDGALPYETGTSARRRPAAGLAWADR
jgi:catechol 2,3-dioxygenase-like lactoylglutathione lyase family enzyme